MNINNFPNVESLSRQATSSNPGSDIEGQRVVIQQIPDEIILVIFSTLSAVDLLHLRLVEKRWKILIDQSLEGVNHSISFKGTTFYGKFKKGKLNGKGKITVADGSIFEGEFKDNGLNGQGKITRADGAIEEGEFKDGELIQGKRKRADEAIVEEKNSKRANRRA